MDGFKRLDRFVHNIEQKHDPKADLPKTVAHENAISKSLDGRSVFDDKRERRPAIKKYKQLDLFG